MPKFAERIPSPYPVININSTEIENMISEHYGWEFSYKDDFIGSIPNVYEIPVIHNKNGRSEIIKIMENSDIKIFIENGFHAGMLDDLLMLMVLHGKLINATYVIKTDW